MRTGVPVISVRVFGKNGAHSLKPSITAFTRAEQVNEVEFIVYLTYPDGHTERHTESFPFRYFFPKEVEHLLARAGFRVAAVYGDFNRSPLANESPEMLTVAEKSGEQESLQ